MSILGSIGNIMKSISQPTNSGEQSSKPIAPSANDPSAETRYIKGSGDRPWTYLRSEAKRLDPALVNPAIHNHPLKALLNEPRVQAMLDTIAYAEGTAQDPDRGYGRVVKGTVTRARYNPKLVGQRNVTTTDFSRHPRILVRVNAKTQSTAAGRYQFLYDTWRGLRLPDFSPESQDLGAIMLLQGRGALKPLLAGNFEKAVRLSKGEWASLPGSPYGQPTRKMEDLKRVYNEALSFYQQRQEGK
jgi:muramidase (phage lysozyme)